MEEFEGALEAPQRISDGTFAAITQATGPIPDNREEWHLWKEKFDFGLEVVKSGGFSLTDAAEQAEAEAEEIRELIAAYREPDDTHAIHSGIMLGIASMRSGRLVLGLSNRYGTVQDPEQARQLWHEHYQDPAARKAADKDAGTEAGVLYSAGIEQFWVEGMETKEGRRVVAAAQANVGKHVSVYKLIKRVDRKDGQAINIRVAQHIEPHPDIDMDDVFRPDEGFDANILSEATDSGVNDAEWDNVLNGGDDAPSEDEWAAALGDTDKAEADTPAVDPEALERVTDGQSLQAEAARLGFSFDDVRAKVTELGHTPGSLRDTEVCRAIFTELAKAA